MKLPLCDFHLRDGELVVAKTSGGTVIRGTRLHLCKAHSKDWKKINANESAVLELLKVVREKVIKIA